MTIRDFLEKDHVRLHGLLEHAEDPESYAAFRRGLLRHISIEEKILLPAVREARGGEPLPIAATLRLQHGAIAALLVPSPRSQVVRTLRNVLAHHNQLEEGPGALYDDCEQILGAEAAAELCDRIVAAPEVPVAKHVDGPLVEQSLRRALARAGFELVEP